MMVVKVLTSGSTGDAATSWRCPRVRVSIGHAGLVWHAGPAWRVQSIYFGVRMRPATMQSTAGGIEEGGGSKEDE